MGVKDPFLFFLAEGDRFPLNLLQFMMSVNLDAEDLRVLCSSDVLFPRAIGTSACGGLAIIVTAMLVVSVELSGIPIVLPIGFLIGQLRYYFVLVHENSLVSGVEQSENFLTRS
ncbi:unnamed protein product [Prunus armeniaca]